MVKVFALVNAEVCKAKEVLSELEKTGLEVYPLFGEYDSSLPKFLFFSSSDLISQRIHRSHG
jgi:hypothetical protein